MAKTKHIKIIKPAVKAGQPAQSEMPPGDGCIPIK